MISDFGFDFYFQKNNEGVIKKTTLINTKKLKIYFAEKYFQINIELNKNLYICTPKVIGGNMAR